jgi:hypothetical protein
MIGNFIAGGSSFDLGNHPALPTRQGGAAHIVIIL